MQRRTIFVSYSRQDSVQVAKAVDLLEAGGADVFRDLDDIQYGDRWEDVIRTQLAEAERVLVFWSMNAQLSEWVKREWMIAISMQKRVVPILLDQTPLPAELGQFHALSNFMLSAPSTKAVTRSSSPYLRWGLVAVGALGLAVMISFATLNLSKQSTDIAIAPTELQPSTDSSSADSAGDDLPASSSAPETGLDTELPSTAIKPDTGGDSVPSYPYIQPAPSISAPASGAGSESSQSKISRYLVGLSGFLVILALMSYVWLRRRRQAQQTWAGEQLVKEIFQE